MRVRTLRSLAPSLLLFACSSRNLASASVELPSALDEHCFQSSLEATAGVAGLRRLDEAGSRGYWFEIEFEHAGAKHTPGFLAVQRELDGGWRVDLEASFGAGSRGAAALRREVLEREQEIVARVVAACSGRAVTFGPPHACGRGEKGSLCVDGKIAAQPAQR